MEAVRGLEDFDYAWLIWEFSANSPQTGLTVRPPRLGGNRRLGVFATRSPFRPNGLGLSCVRIDRIEEDVKLGPVIFIKGADLMDGTPIYDIKPYVSYADSHPDARCGFVDKSEWKGLEGIIPESVSLPFSQEEKSSLREVLALDPRPRYQEDEERIYGMQFDRYDVHFKVAGRVLTIVDCIPSVISYESLWHRLTGIYDATEAKSVVRWVLDVRFGLSLADILCGKVETLSGYDRLELGRIMQRLEDGEPVQYIIGVADFCGRLFRVDSGVLIPRPETAELCRWIITTQKDRNDVPSPSVLDIGTGSGCIAVTLAAELPEAKVTAWDISEDALHVARENARCTDVDVTFEQCDILNVTADDRRWDMIVSNPPYICDKEKESMERNVLDYEPHQALFVPDDDPLRFYKAIARYASKSLKPGGILYFELNPLYAHQTEAMLQDEGFGKTELRQDQYGKQRFLKAMKI